MEQTKKTRKISASFILNILVILISVGLIIYFFISENGFIDLIRSDRKIIAGWILMAILAQLTNMFIDSVVTCLFIRVRYKFFSLWDGIKVCLVGQFFSAITPSSTGGQPMQVYLMAKMNIEAGFGTSAMMQKFIIYQLTSTAYSIIAIILRLDYFLSQINTTAMWILVVVGFLSQMVVTFGFVLVSFNKAIARKLLKLLNKILHKIKFIKKPDEKIAFLSEQIDMFYHSNKLFSKNRKLMLTSYLLVILQITAILSVPYFIYRAFDQHSASVIDMICSQAYVNLASSMIPLPGASGAAEIGFSAFFGMFFAPETIKSAILVWRIITYYGTILMCAPFSHFTKDKRLRDAEKEIIAQSEPELLPEDDLNNTSDEGC
ncbi:MAG: YbhN family protein [Acutalibacteraceae bacterium]